MGRAGVRARLQGVVAVACAARRAAGRQTHERSADARAAGGAAGSARPSGVRAPVLGQSRSWLPGSLGARRRAVSTVRWGHAGCDAAAPPNAARHAWAKWCGQAWPEVGWAQALRCAV